MTTSQLILQFLGWGLLVYLHIRNLRFSEISRIKDTIVKQLGKIMSSCKSELAIENANILAIESNLSAKASQLEFKINQLNDYARLTIVSTDCIAKIRNIDIEITYATKQVDKVFDEVENDLIEEIEGNYVKKLYKINFFRHLYLNRMPELLGALIPLSILYFLYLLIDLFTQN